MRERRRRAEVDEGIADGAAELFDLRRVRRDVELKVPAEVAPVEHLCLESHLDAVFVDAPSVDELRASAEAIRRRNAAREDRIARDVIKECEIDAEAVVQNAHLEAELSADHAFRLEIGVAERA